MKKRERSEPQLLKSTLKEILYDAEDKCGNIFSRITQAWDMAVDEKLKRHATLQKMSNDTLFIGVDTATWLYEIERKYKHDIIKKLNSKLGEKVIKKIVLHVCA